MTTMRDVDRPLRLIVDARPGDERRVVAWAIRHQSSRSCSAPPGVTGRDVERLIGLRLARVDRDRAVVATHTGRERIRAWPLNDAVVRAARALALAPNAAQRAVS